MGNGRATTNTFQPAAKSAAAVPLFQRRSFASDPATADTETPAPQPAQTDAPAPTPIDIPLFAAPPPMQREPAGADSADEREEDGEGPDLQGKLQAKLTVGAPGDRYEQEADLTAAQVMAMPDPAAAPAIPLLPLQARALQRDEQPDLEEEETSALVQARGDGLPGSASDSELEAADRLLPKSLPAAQIQAKGEPFQAPADFGARLSQHKGGGQPLAPKTRAFMEPRFGADFSGVRVHEAPQEAGAIGAQAFTHGQDIYFNSGKYNPGSSGGKELLAHELTHTIQQTGGQVRAKDSRELGQGQKANKDTSQGTLQTKSVGALAGLPTVQRREAPTPTDASAAPAPVAPAPVDASAAPVTQPEAPAATEPSSQPEQAASDSAQGQSQGQAAEQASSGEGATATASAAPVASEGAASEGAAVQIADGASAAEIEAPVAESSANASPAVGGAVPAASASGSGSVPASPEADPGFQAVVAQSGAVATEKKQHDPAEAESAEAQAAAVSPASEVDSQAQDQQVADMAQQEPGTFDGEAFKAEILSQLAAITPNNEEEAENFKDSNQIDGVKDSVAGQLSTEQEQAAAPIEDTAEAEPDTSGIEPRQSTPMVEPDMGAVPTGIDGAQAAPKPKTEGEVSAPLEANSQSLDQQMAEANITEEQLANSNEPEFMGALAAKDEAQTDAAAAPGAYRAQEEGILSQAQGQAQATVTSQMQGMHGQREQLLTQMVGVQDTTKSKDEQKRTEIADHINGIYERVKTEVETSLDGLSNEVITKFENAANQGKQVFEDYVDRKMTAYKKDRYGEGIEVLEADKLFNRGRDFVKGLPDEVNQFFVEGREQFIQAIDGPLTEISNLVANRLNGAKDKVAQGRKEIQDYVQSLPEDLQQVGQEAAQDVQTKFDELEQSVDAKKDELVSTIVQKYQENLQAVDARIEEMKEQNKGFIDKAKDALGGTIQKVLELKAMLEGVLARAAGAAENIIKDPIGFLSNLVSGVTQGLNNFLGNIWEHLQGGLVGWLTGALGPMGISIPEDIASLPGIFDLVMQVLGLTWGYIRGKAVKLFGEPVVGAMETGVEMVQVVKERGAEGLWEEVQADFADLKETVIDQIKDMVITQVITAGVKWIIGLLNPASAFVKACMAIYDIVMFFINQGSQVLELVNAIVESISAIASGAVGGAAQLVEQALVKALPVAIGFLASLLGISGLAKKVQGIIGKIRQRIDGAIDKLLKKAKKLFKKKKGNKEEVKDPDHGKKVKAGLDDIDKEEQKYLDKGEISEEDAVKVASTIKQKHPVFKSVTVIDGGDKWDYRYVASPPKTKKGEKKLNSGKVSLSKLDGWRPSWRKSTDNELASRKENKDYFYIRKGKVKLKKKSKVNRRHKVSFEVIVKDLKSKVEGKTYQKGFTVMKTLGYKPIKENNSEILKAGKAYLRDKFNDPKNVWVGDAEENQEMGRKISSLLRKLSSAQDELRSLKGQPKEEIKKVRPVITKRITEIVDELQRCRLDTPRGKTVRATQEYLDMLEAQKRRDLNLIKTIEK